MLPGSALGISALPESAMPRGTAFPVPTPGVSGLSQAAFFTGESIVNRLRPLLDPQEKDG